MKQKYPIPQVIFLDAMGTLFDLKENVGEIYRAIAFKYGVIANAEKIEDAFFESFKSATPLAFSAISEEEKLLRQEYIWWRQLVEKTFIKLDKLDDFTDFEDFFAELYAYFLTPEPWYVYPDVITNLEKWQRKDIQLGIVSNFDSRLYQILDLLKIKHFFTTITISSRAGFAKPDSRIFTIALSKHDCYARKAWHIGDNFSEDYQGAKKAGIKAFWLNRPQPLRVS